MLKLARLLAIPVLATLALTTPTVVAPREAPAAQAAQYRVFGPYISRDLAVTWQGIARSQGWTVGEIFETQYDFFGVNSPLPGWAFGAVHP